eukprot:1159385-Pelagomonas_calceolata.AAC.1
MGFPVKKAEVREMLRRHGEEEDVQRLEFSIFKRIVAGEAGFSKRTCATSFHSMKGADGKQVGGWHSRGRQRVTYSCTCLRGWLKLKRCLRANQSDLEKKSKVVKSLGLDIQQEELQSMIDEFDLDKDGMISQAEFISMLMSDD